MSSNTPCVDVEPSPQRIPQLNVSLPAQTVHFIFTVCPLATMHNLAHRCAVSPMYERASVAAVEPWTSSSTIVILVHRPGPPSTTNSIVLGRFLTASRSPLRVCHQPGVCGYVSGRCSSIYRQFQNVWRSGNREYRMYWLVHRAACLSIVSALLRSDVWVHGGQGTL